MNLFGFKARRVSARPVLARPFGAGLAASVYGPHAVQAVPDALPQSAEERARAAYGDNVIAQRAVRLVAEAVASAPLACDDPRVLALLAGRSGGQALLETAATQLLLHGNAYIQIIAGAEDQAAELFALRPERVTIALDRDGWPSAYAYRAGGDVVRIAAEDAGGRAGIAHVRLLNPLNDHYGLGALSAAARPVAVHNAAMRWNQALLDNAARPSGALVYDPGEAGASLSPDQFERLAAEMATQFQGAGNAGRPMLLDGGLKWQAISLSPADMDFIALKDSAARDIAMAFGVPPMLLGLPGDATYANYREASKVLWRQTVLPLAHTLLVGIGQALATWGVTAAARVDLDQVTPLAEDRERLWAQVSGADFLSAAEKRAILGVGPGV